MCSRREADKIIKENRVTINNVNAKLGMRVFDGDTVKIDGQPIKSKTQTLYIAFNKPVGIVCTTDSKEPKNIIDYINHPQRLFPVGRLDKPSQGLIFLTNDGDIVNKILRAGNNHEKEYIVTVDKKVNQKFIKNMSQGVQILGTVTKKCKVEPIDKNTFKITLTQGLNRQIRRMCKHLGYKVLRLQRIRIMNITIEGLKPGEWREFSLQEINQLQKLIKNSSKTEEASKLPKAMKKKRRR